MTRLFNVCGLALVLGLAFIAGPAKADTGAQPGALATLETMVGNLGYTTTDAADKKAFSITWPGNYNYTINFDVSKDSTIAYAYVDLSTFTQAQLAKLQYIKLLQTNDVSDFYFSMEEKAPGQRLFANSIIPLQGLTPQSLRSTLNVYAGKLDDSAALWDPTLWK